ncbi:MAG TPA: PilZ domain-containing protein [Chitinispirillaceae bacterium]|nr:PilZ domain-containing protein [Chitinispirillaceae bacterium]
MKERRFYQRYTLSEEQRNALQVEIKFDGTSVRLVDFSLGGLCVISEKSYVVGDIVTILVNLADRGRIDLVGKVVRVNRMDKAWSVAIDLSKNYKLNSLCKL